MGDSPIQYEAKDSRAYKRDQLVQGDVLERTEDLARVLQGFYPYAFLHPEKYPYFVVLTQSCDLVAEGERSRKADHITLSATRPLHLFLDQEVLRLQPPPLRKINVGLKSHRNKLFQKIERLLSNEEHPYFYLHPSGETPFTEPHVAYLRVTFPVRTDEHYDVCVKAKRVQLSPQFRAKLGWLTTLVFGRVATDDFSPDERRDFANQYVDGHGTKWIKADVLQREAKKKFGSGWGDLSPEDLEELIAAVEQKSQPERVADVMVGIARKIWPHDQSLLEKFRDRLLQDADFRATQGN